MVKRISTSDHARITAAIQKAEAATSGEIFCVLANEVSTYRDISLLWAAGAAFLLPLGLIPFGFEPSWIPGMAAGWDAAHLSGRVTETSQALAAYALIQSAVFVLVYAALRFPPLRRRVTPRGVRLSRVRKAALHQFLAHGLHVTEDRTGVLIFAALGDHQVEIIADKGIHSRVDQAVWADAVEALTGHLRDDRPAEGFEAAIGLVGTVLAEHFPPRARNPDEIANRLVEI
jgi:putative membrane protein